MLRVLSLALLLFPHCLAGAADVAERASVAEFARPGRVLMLRHAYAPGIGDPANFALGDCSTQRNLDAAGRAQARALGERLKRALGGVKAKVYSSQWCRCLETAKLLGLGPVEELPALNSFFDRHADREPRLAALRKFFAALPTQGPPVVLVTHQVTITAITGTGVASGGGALFEANASGAPGPLGAFESD